jgi:3-oxoadipate CoA-transferase beta subunit
MYVNLGVGIPTLVADFATDEREIMFQSENGILGVGPAAKPGLEHDNIVNANEQKVTLRPGGSFFSHSESFMMIRGGHIDLALLGAFEVSINGDLANWATPMRNEPPAVGGAMDLVAGAKEIWVLMQHCTRNGHPKIVTKCSYPLTGINVVRRIFTDLSVISVTASGLVVNEIVDGMSLEELQARTAAPLSLAVDWCRLVCSSAAASRERVV